ncbi:MAG: LEA type 2 family protein [Bacteroidetes bacterium]|nr:LEA type 2 family protein [Bacteroidota bacterium]
MLKQVIVGGVMAVLILINGCSGPSDLEFRKVSNVKFSMMGKPKVTADVVLYNPNRIAMELRSADLDIRIDGKSAGKVNQTFQLKLPKQSEFVLPVEVGLSLRESGLLGTLLGMVNGKTLKVEFMGEVKVKIKSVPASVRVYHTEEIKL